MPKPKTKKPSDYMSGTGSRAMTPDYKIRGSNALPPIRVGVQRSGKVQEMLMKGRPQKALGTSVINGTDAWSYEAPPKFGGR